MLEYLSDLISRLILHTDNSSYISYAILTILFIIFILIVNFISRKIIMKISSTALNDINRRFKWHSIMLERKFYQRLAHIIPAIIIFAFATTLPENYGLWIQRLTTTYILVIAILSFDALLNTLNDIYKCYKISKIKPIKGYLQMIKVFVYALGAILIIANLIGQSPLILLGGIGAFTAVLLLVFSDSILGLVAGIQLTANDMVRIGDWIEMPKYGADGDIIDISLNTVKVQNFDRTITTIPTYALISDYFKNWRGMQESGGRRIKRAIFIDVNSIKFCTKEMIEKFKKIHYLKEYIARKEKELEEYNKKHDIDPSIKVNGRRLTNIGVFRAYIDNYLKNHPNTHKDLLQLVRQLEPGEYGLPLEIYVFTNDIQWINYESIQADIFDHILSVASEFELRIFQNPSGYDINQGFLKTRPK